MSQEELATKKRALQQVRHQIARYGISAPVNLIMDEEDLMKDIRAIERELGIDQTPTIQERRATSAVPRYTPLPEPEPTFQRRIDNQQAIARQSDITHQMGLLNTYRRNLAHMRAQLKELGAYAPPYVRNGVAETQQEIANRKRILRDYGVTVDDLAGDE